MNQIGGAQPKFEKNLVVFGFVLVPSSADSWDSICRGVRSSLINHLSR